MSGTDSALGEGSPTAPTPARHRVWRALLHAFPAVLGAILFVIALLVLRHELQRGTLLDVRAYLETLPLGRTLTAFALALASYLALTAYDALALRYLARVLPY